MFCEKAAHQKQMYKLSSPPSNEKWQKKRPIPSLWQQYLLITWHLLESSPVNILSTSPGTLLGPEHSSYSITLNLLYSGVQHGRAKIEKESEEERKPSISQCCCSAVVRRGHSKTARFNHICLCVLVLGTRPSSYSLRAGSGETLRLMLLC